MLPGVNKLGWASPRHQTDFYQRDALRCCKDVAAAAAELRAASAAVASTCALCKEALLVRVERKRLHDLPGWEARQAAHQVRAWLRRDPHPCRACCVVWGANPRGHPPALGPPRQRSWEAARGRGAHM